MSAPRTRTTAGQAAALRGFSLLVSLSPCLLVSLSCLLTGCAGGHLNFLGYTTRPNYDEGIRTVYVPIFQNRLFQAGPFRGLEFTLTEAVQREIEARTPYKVVSYREGADTELLGTIVSQPKNVILRNQQNEVREAEIVLGVEVIWRDLRCGDVLSQPKPPGSEPPPEVFDPANPPPPGAQPVPRPVLVNAQTTLIPEVGQSVASTLQRNADKLAVQIVNMMERPW
jgi:Lipopolysaccharide-assembly